jgi:integrase
MSTSYDVRVWNIEVYEGKRGNSYYLRWAVAGRRHRKPFRNRPLADSFRSELVTAARKGEPFDIETGLPATMRQATGNLPFYTVACQYADFKWPHVAATTRRTHAEALTAITTALLVGDRGKPDDKLIRKALCRWAFNTARRNQPSRPAEVRTTLRWIETHTRNVGDLSNPAVLRSVLHHLVVKLDGTPAAPSVATRRRRILNALLEYAAEKGMLHANPMPALNWKPPTTVRAKPLQPVDRRRVASPLQVRTLLDSVRQQPRSGPLLVAFYACLYFAALRPEEAVALGKPNLDLPERGWGQLHLGTAEPYAGKDWTDSGANRDRRQLKQRPIGEVRTVPCCPELTAIIHTHIAAFGFGPDGRLFVGERNSQELPKLTIVRVWKRARADVFIPEVAASPLAATPYDLRHAGVTGWLNAGVPVPEVAEWAGHSPEVLWRIYAKCVDSSIHVHRRRIERFYGHGQDDR